MLHGWILEVAVLILFSINKQFQMRIILQAFPLLIFTVVSCFSQEFHIKGVIADAKAKEPIPFVNIGILNKNRGTISNMDGEFSLHIPDTFANDSVTISHVSFHVQKVKVGLLGNDTIFLQPNTTQLSEVIVSNKKIKKRKIGVKSFNRLLSMRVISKNNDILEVAQRINVPDSEVKITAVNFAIKKWSKLDGTLIRINFYENRDNVPQERILQKNILKDIPPRTDTDWIHIDLINEDLFITKDFFIGIEFIPNFESSTIVDLGGILTKGKGYYRENSLGSWKKLNGGASINVEIEY